MKTTARLACTCALWFAMTASLHAKFLVLKIRETTADSIWHWTIAAVAGLIFFTLRASRSQSR